MKIKKHGKYSQPKEKEKFESFKCENCGCEFSVKEDEYYRDYGASRDSSSWQKTITLTYTWLPKDLLVCCCPECYKICKKSVNSNTTITGCYSCGNVSNASNDSITVDKVDSTFTAEDNLTDWITDNLNIKGVKEGIKQ